MPKRPNIPALDLSLLDGGPDGDRHPVEAFTEDSDAGRIVNIPVEAIAPNPDQPRKHFDPEALEDLTRSVKERGILQPIIVRRTGDGAFALIAGERRWRAAKAAGLAKVPALVRQREDPAEIALIENLQREDLNPIEEAESLQLLKSRRRLTDEQLAKIIGKSRVSVTESLSLTRLPDPVKAECRTSDIWPKGQLLQVLRQPTPDRQLALWQALKAGNFTVREARAAAKANGDPQPRPKHYEYKYQPKTKGFTVRVTFRKSRATYDETREALREALKNLT